MPFKRSLASQAGVAPPTRPRLTLLHEGFALAPATRALTEKPASAASVASPATPGGGPRERGSGEPKPYGRGSAEAAISAAQDPQQCRMELAKDVLAETTKGPTASRQKLWATLAKTAGWLDPFHLDPSMIFTIMGALKRGGYRSAQLYLDTAKNCHIALGFTWDDQLQQAYRSAVRSCKRGIGHPKQAAHLPLDKVALIDYEPALVNGGPQFPVAATVLASWWLLREIEASRARRKHIEIDETNQKVTWRLPSSKTDQAALGAARSHTCACSLHRKELCPYHVAVEHLNKLPPGPDQYIFPAADGHSSTKKGWADAFEALAKILEIPITHQNGARAFTGHTARVSGARFMATNNIELWRIQLFRRWGSEVFLHYIQDAPLAQLDMLALESTAAMSVHKAREELELLQRRIKDCKASFMAPELDMLEDCAASVHLTHQEENLPGRDGRSLKSSDLVEEADLAGGAVYHFEYLGPEVAEAQSQMTMAGAEPEERCGVRVSARGVHKDCPRDPEPLPAASTAPASASTARWRITGGADKGGIIVRQSESLKSPELGRAREPREQQVSTGAIVEEVGGGKWPSERMGFLSKGGIVLDPKESAVEEKSQVRREPSYHLERAQFMKTFSWLSRARIRLVSARRLEQSLDLPGYQAVVKRYNETLILESISWQVLRRMRLLATPELLQEGCDWLGYFRANSLVNTGAVRAVLEFLSKSLGWSMETPVLLGRGIIAEQHGVTMPALTWGKDLLEVVWSSRGLLLNHAALKRLSLLMSGRLGQTMSKGVLDICHIFLPQLPILQSGLVYAFGGDSHMQGLAEFVFAAALRGHDPSLKLQWMPEQAERFLEGGLLLERFAFRVASATFGWSRRDWKVAGLPSELRSQPRGLRGFPHRSPRRKLRQGGTVLSGSCVQRDWRAPRCRRSLLPQCVLVFYPVESPEKMKDMHKVVSKTACLAASTFRPRKWRVPVANTRSPDVPVANAPDTTSTAVLSRGQLFTRTSTGATVRIESARSPWCRSVSKNRRVLSRLVSFSWSLQPFRRSSELVPARGGHEPCPKLHFAPRLRPMWETFEHPVALHQDEWAVGTD
ncbi:unnamed protein product [Durusdinium trenchii]|uniref:Uncharacterized protein n=1 Tax=Durusdinium trenchii TaxID=1381693 RepID=A0ABP0H5R5_9DINO